MTGFITELNKAHDTDVSEVTVLASNENQMSTSSQTHERSEPTPVPQIL